MRGKSIDEGIDHGLMRCGDLGRVIEEIMIVTETTIVTETAFVLVAMWTENVEIGVETGVVRKIAATSAASVMNDITQRG